jgi:hypothetical protein
MSSQQRFRRPLMASSFWIVVLAAPATTQDIRDWPCDSPLAERFDPVQIWGSPLPTPLPEGWRQKCSGTRGGRVCG